MMGVFFFFGLFLRSFASIIALHRIAIAIAIAIEEEEEQQQQHSKKSSTVRQFGGVPSSPPFISFHFFFFLQVVQSGDCGRVVDW